MQIYSNFKDYYDVGMKYGTDPTCKYIRKTEWFQYEKDNQQTNHIIDLVMDSVRSTGILKSISYCNRSITSPCFDIILFCGMLYVAVEFNDKEIQYNADEIRSFYERNIKSDRWGGDTKYFLESLEERKSIHKCGSNKFTYKGMSDFFKVYQGSKFDKIHDLMATIKIPIILIKNHNDIRYRKIIYNPSLRSLFFFKIKDPFSTYQELNTFISGVLGGESPPMIQIDDITRLEKHGFDKKISFRKPSQDRNIE